MFELYMIILFGNPLNIIFMYTHSKNSLTEIMKILPHHLYCWTAGSLEKYSEPRGKIENSRVQVTCLRHPKPKVIIGAII